MEGMRAEPSPAVPNCPCCEPGSTDKPNSQHSRLRILQPQQSWNNLMEGRAGSEIAFLRVVARGLPTPVSRAGQTQPPSKCVLVSTLIFCFHNFKNQNEQFTDKGALFGLVFGGWKVQEHVLHSGEDMSYTLVPGGRERTHLGVTKTERSPEPPLYIRIPTCDSRATPATMRPSAHDRRTQNP